MPDFNTMYELYDPCTLMFFFRNKVRIKNPCDKAQLLWDRCAAAAAVMCVTMCARPVCCSRPLRDVATSHCVAEGGHCLDAERALRCSLAGVCCAAHHD